MLHTMKRRGPDQQHIYTDEAVTLLHARLSVMDLQHGRQPMQLKSDSRYVMVDNGELYNTEELRSRLQEKGYTFQETSDTEVLPVSYTHLEVYKRQGLVGVLLSRVPAN